MTQVQFYQLTATPFERALPRILEKAVSGNYKILLVVDSEEKEEFFNQSLWTYTPNSFLPHGTKKDALPERQPVFISTTIESPNGADLLFITEGSIPDKPENYKRILDMFDGHNAESVEAARKRWKHYKEAGHNIAYFSQKPDGAWEQKVA